MDCLNEVESAAEAARQWGLDESTVKKKCEHEGTKLQWKKSGRVKLVTRESMDLEFGAIVERIKKGKHNDPAYGVASLLKNGATIESLLGAGIPEELLKLASDCQTERSNHD